MSDNQATHISKTAEDPLWDKVKKYGVPALVAGSTAAAIGAIVHNNRAKKDAAKRRDVNKLRNAIVVNINKKRFMSDLPTPQELAESRGEAPATGENAIATPEVASQSETPATPATAAPSKPVDLSDPKALAAAKKELLRSSGRRLSMFGKAAEDSGEAASEGDAAGKDASRKPDDRNGEGVRPPLDNSGKQERKVDSPRDELGRFVSKTDPVGVEKAAEDDEPGLVLGTIKNILHPLSSAADAFAHGTRNSAGIIATGAIATGAAMLIAKTINERRKKRAEEALDDARNAYVASLQNDNIEKSALNDPATILGDVYTGAAMIPGALAAMLTYKIMENRDKEKKEKKGLTDSIPDEPLVFYKTSSAEEISTSINSIACAAMVKSAMLNWLDKPLEKSASEEKTGASGKWFVSRMFDGAVEAKNSLGRLSRIKSNYEKGVRINDKDLGWAIGELGTGKKMYENYANQLDSLKLLQSIRGHGKNYGDAARTLVGNDIFRKELEQADFGSVKNDGAIDLTKNQNLNRFRAQVGDDTMRGIAKAPEFADEIVKFHNSSKTLQDKMNGAIRGNIYGALGGENWFSKLIAWLASVTGIGRYMYNRNLRSAIGNAKFVPDAPQSTQTPAQAGNRAAAPGQNGVVVQVR